MQDKPIEVVIAESKALIAENESLTSRIDALIEEARVMAARAVNRDPENFDIEAYLREALSPAEFDKLSRDARAQWEQMAAEHGLPHPSEQVSVPVTRPPGARPHRRMV